MLPQDDAAPPTSRTWSRKEALTLLLFLLLPALGFVALRAQRTNFAGVYLIAGGQGYMHVEDTPTGPVVSHFQWMHYTGKYRLRTLRGTRLIADSGSGGDIVFHLAPSQTRAGDLDLVMVDQLPSGTGPFEKALRWALEVWNWKDSPSGAPIPNFFHRVRDPEALQYMRLAGKDPSAALEYMRLAGKDPSAPLAGHASAPATTATLFVPSPNSAQLVHTARAMLSRSPEDPYLRLLMLDALLRANEGAEAQKLLAQWQPDFERNKTSDPVPHALLPPIERKANGLVAARSGKNAYGNLLRALARGTSFEEGLQAISQTLEMEALSQPGGFTHADENVINFLEAQTRVKGANAQALLELFNGNTDRAIAITLGAYRLGQLLQWQDDHLITKLIAIAIRSITTRSLLVLIASAPLTVEQSRYIGEQLNRMHADEELAATVNLSDSSLGVVIPSGGFAAPNYVEARTRNDVAYARFEAVRAIAAARHILIATAKLPDPAGGAGLPPLLPAGPGIDPFSPTSAALRLLLNTTSNTLLAYSVGPDGRDDLGTVEYDPTNGTVSSGDITAELRAVPQFPFKPGGIQAATTAALFAQFPEGLPTDPFQDQRSSPDHLGGAETTESVVIFSLGPDRRAENYSDGTAVPYDPTNGTVSAGDIMMRLRR